jgi:hypothetical protein
MGDGSAGPVGQALTKNIGAVAQEAILEDLMMGALKVPVQAGDNKGAQARFQSVRDLVGNMTPEHAGELLDKLNTKNSNDPLAKEIKHTFSDVSVEKLKKDLAAKSGRAIDPQTTETKPGNTSAGTPLDKQQRKNETNARGQVKAEDLFGSLKQAELEKKVEKRADTIFWASDVMHKYPHLIEDNLRGLTKEEGEALARVWQKKYGTSLDGHLQKELKGQQLENAKDMLAGHTDWVDQRDASRRSNKLAHAFDASPVDKNAIMENLRFLKPGQREMVEKMFEERFGQSLLSMLTKNLTGDDLQQAINMLEGKYGMGMPKDMGGIFNENL